MRKIIEVLRRAWKHRKVLCFQSTKEIIFKNKALTDTKLAEPRRDYKVSNQTPNTSNKRPNLLIDSSQLHTKTHKISKR